MVRRQRHLQERYRAWLELLDLSTQLAMAGMKTQGLSDAQSWKRWCRRWTKAAHEHQEANRQIVRRLRAKDRAR